MHRYCLKERNHLQQSRQHTLQGRDPRTAENLLGVWPLLKRAFRFSPLKRCPVFILFFLTRLYSVPTPEKKTVGEKLSRKELFLADMARPAVCKASKGPGCTLQDTQTTMGRVFSFNSRTKFGLAHFPCSSVSKCGMSLVTPEGMGPLSDRQLEGEDKTAKIIFDYQIAVDG